MRTRTLGTLAGRLRGPLDGDAALLDRIRAVRDPAAFEAVVRQHGPAVLAACRKVLADPADVDDAFQATFLVLLRDPCGRIPGGLGLALRRRPPRRPAGGAARRRNAWRPPRSGRRRAPPDRRRDHAAGGVRDRACGTRPVAGLVPPAAPALPPRRADARRGGGEDSGARSEASRGRLERGREAAAAAGADADVVPTAALLAAVGGSAAAGGPTPELIGQLSRRRRAAARSPPSSRGRAVMIPDPSRPWPPSSRSPASSPPERSRPTAILLHPARRRSPRRRVPQSRVVHLRRTRPRPGRQAVAGARSFLRADPGVIEYGALPPRGRTGRSASSSVATSSATRAKVPPGRSPPKPSSTSPPAPPAAASRTAWASQPEDREDHDAPPVEEVVKGRIVDLEGKPVAGAKVYSTFATRAGKGRQPLPYDAQGQAGGGRRTPPHSTRDRHGATSDADGRIVLRGLARGWL